MKILFITDNFPPEVNAPARRTFEHCRQWVNKGVDVTVLTCAPNFPKGRVFRGYENKWKHTEEMDGIKVVRLWSYMTTNSGFIKRSLDYFSFAVTSFIAGLKEQPDVIVATSPQFFTTWSAWALSKLKKVPWVFELRDLWPESIKAVGMMGDSFVYKLLEKIEMGLYRDAALIVPNTNSFRQNLIDRGIDANKIKVIQNGSDIDMFKRLSGSGNTRSELSLNNKFIVGYLGTHGLAHGLDFILECAAKVTNQDIHFLFIGDGAEKNNLLQLKKKLKLNNVTFLNSVSIEEVPGILRTMDVSLVPLRRSDTFKTVIPSKIFEAGICGVPVLLGVDGEARQIIEEYETGLFFEPENAEDFINKLNSLCLDKNLYEKCSDNGRKFAMKFDRNVMANNMLKIIMEKTIPEAKRVSDQVLEPVH